MTLEPKIAFYMTKEGSATSHFDAPMARCLIKYTKEWRFDEQHWLLVSLTCSLKGLEILANEGNAQKVAKYAENLYAPNHTSSRGAG